MSASKYAWMLWGLALFAVTTDLTTKYVVFRWLDRDGAGGQHDVWAGHFMLIAQNSGQPIESESWRGSLQAYNGTTLPHVNNGALFGIGNSYPGFANNFFAVVSVLAAGAIAVWSRRVIQSRDAVLASALGLILGGTLGNLFDRLIFHGVRDFLYYYWINWPVFNFADCCLVSGAGLLLLQAFWPGRVPSTSGIDAKLEATAAR